MASSQSQSQQSHTHSQSSSQLSSQLVSQLLPQLPQQTTAIVLMTTTTSTAKTNNTFNEELINNNNNNNNGVVCDILAKATETIFSAPTASQPTSALLITSDNSSTARLLLPPKLEPIYPTNTQMSYSSQLSNKNDIHAILLLSEERHAPTLQPIIEMPLEQPPVLSMPPKIAINDVIVTTSNSQTISNTTTTPLSINTIQSTQQPIVPLLISLPPQKTNSTPPVLTQQMPSADKIQIDANNDNNNNINDVVYHEKVDDIPVLEAEDVSKSLPIIESHASPDEQLLSSSLSPEPQSATKSPQNETSEELNLKSLTKIDNTLPIAIEAEESSVHSSIPNDTYSSTNVVNTTAEPQPSLSSESIPQNEIHSNDCLVSATTDLPSNPIASPPLLSEINKEIDIPVMTPQPPPVITNIVVSNKKQQSFTNVDQKPPQLQPQEISCKSNLICATKSTPISANTSGNSLFAAQQKSKLISESLGDNLPTKTEEKVPKVRKRTRDTNTKLKTEDINAEPRVSKRVRLQYQPFQSPEPLAVMPYACRSSTVSLKSSNAKEEELADKVVIYNRGEFLAVRNEKDDFFICRTYQNVYKNSHKFKIQWFTNENNSIHNQMKDVYMPDFFDRLDFECVLTNLTVTRVDKDQYRLSADEKQRTINILQRAINREKGINDSLNPSQVVSDGIDVSIVGKAEEKELLEKMSPKRVKQENKSSAKNKKLKTETDSGVKKKEITPIKKLIKKRKRVLLSKTKANTKAEVKRDAALNTKAKYLKKRTKLVAKSDSKVSKITITTVTRGKPKVSPITITAITSRPKTAASRKSVVPEKTKYNNNPGIKMTISPVYSVSSRTPSSRAIKTNNLKVKSKSSEKSLPNRNNKPTNISKPVSKEIKSKRVKQNDLKEKSRISERVRLHYQPFQSVDTPQQISGVTTRTLPSNTKTLSRIAAKSTKEEEEEGEDGEPVIYNKGEFLAVRNEENSFFICRTFQNVFKNSHKFKMQWFSDDNTPSVFTADFYDHIDFECILTNLTLTRLDKGQYSLPFEERQRTMNILQRAINMEKGILPQNASKVTADGVDVSVVGKPEEKELLKKISLQSKVNKQKSAINKNNKESNTVFAKKSKTLKTTDDTNKQEKVSNKVAKSSAPAVATTSNESTTSPTTPPRRSLRQASTCSSSSVSSNFKLI